MAKIDIQDAFFDEDTQKWYATVKIDSDKGATIGPQVFDLPRETTLADMIDIVKKQWETVPDIKSYTVKASEKTTEFIAPVVEEEVPV